jgi:hypothetical protein
MPANLTEFTDDTAFERYLLDRATPLLPRSQGTSVIELGEAGSVGVAVGGPAATVHVGSGDSAGAAEGAAAGKLSADDIRPLLFGAAWKVLDLLCELALERAGVAHDQGWRYTIAFKVGEAASGRVAPPPPFDSRADLWARIMGTYASTEQLRNSLVHRRLVIAPVTGDISGAGSPSQPAPVPATADEQVAFCQIAVGAAEAAIDGTLPTRRAGQLAWALDQLTSHHGQPSLGASPVEGVIPRVIVQASPGPPNDLTLDFSDIGNCARAAAPGASHHDLEIHLPDSRVLAGALEDAPSGQATFPLATPPGWLRWI